MRVCALQHAHCSVNLERRYDQFHLQMKKLSFAITELMVAELSRNPALPASASLCPDLFLSLKSEWGAPRSEAKMPPSLPLGSYPQDACPRPSKVSDPPSRYRPTLRKAAEATERPRRPSLTFNLRTNHLAASGKAQPSLGLRPSMQPNNPGGPCQEKTLILIGHVSQRLTCCFSVVFRSNSPREVMSNLKGEEQGRKAQKVDARGDILGQTDALVTARTMV